ncbi:MAG: hypothetical protein K2M16_02240 [Muribaculaceae bacterium]|nr:hypothetical protein [Muribaculaceae bacterium]
MKTTDKVLGFASMAGVMLAMGACSTEPNFQPSMAGIPQASDYQIGISVDEFNNVELNILDKNGQNAKGVYPVWYVNESTRPSTALTYRDLITIAGEYPVEMKVGNGNGVSEGSVTGTIHIDKTIFDFTPYMKALTDNETKEWAVNGETPGNMGCGPATNPTEWWSSGPNEKEAEGVYSNILTFGYTDSETSGSYVYNPGESGTMYVNKGVHTLQGYTVNNPENDADFRVDTQEIATEFTLSPEGANLYLVLPPHTPFPYIPSEDAFNNPKYRIVSFSKSSITLVQDLDGISWQYIIAPKAEDTSFKGFKYDSEYNMWKTAEVTLQSTYFTGENWDGGLEPDVIEVSNEKIFVHTPAAMGSDQWKGQVHVGTDIQVSADETYDFSCKVESKVDSKVTVKVQMDGDDGVSFAGQDQIAFDAGGSYYYFSDLKGFDGQLKIAFDFAGYPDTDFTITDIVFKKHSDDDGTVLPDLPSEPEKPVKWVDVDSPDNLFHGCTWTNTFYYAPGWAQIADPVVNVDGNTISVTLPEATTDQWQAQVAFHTDITTSADKLYDFRVTFYSNKEHPGVTFKCVLSGGGDNDNIFYMADRLKLTEYEDQTYSWIGLPGIDMDKMSVFLDFGGNAAGTEIQIKDIIIQEHRE